MLEITPGVAIADEELSFEVSRSGGPGGQNVNKVETRVAVCLNVDASPALGAQQRQRVRERLHTRISKAGVLRVVCQVHRSQSANREEAVRRLRDLLREALAEDAPRVPTRPSRAARERRLAEKTMAARRKALRRTRPDEE
ncbi:MAG TPA: alternative ribosome rescue aminoacyl-tRNA hydrolase ArfB [Thermoanaerobaculaceae bacterium]|nr:alternative ribosome rescue aminoacyl-tRNA hydrolase ArfB [Thermoanaerobaculaceae bacterium]HPS76724.1 alternative ribosome rescue aminoacyl-tRNA hydrolase ArfB [Thermoanaerobaculaceae bacterium]